MPFPGFKPRPNGTAVSVTNHYAGTEAKNIRIIIRNEKKNKVLAECYFKKIPVRLHVPSTYLCYKYRFSDKFSSMREKPFPCETHFTAVIPIRQRSNSAVVRIEIKYTVTKPSVNHAKRRRLNTFETLILFVL
ncbi:hypothetical protein TNCV_103111 [Trichonephila clavipes]|nr:hypothetical protein TNCV_103111 [Trichonephila clavipes]